MFSSPASAILPALLATIANAAIYPTRPIQDTQYACGQPAVIEWNEDAASGPMGPFRVELFAGNDTYIATLARNLRQQDKSYTVLLSRDLPYIGDDYTMRFISTDPPKTIYTGDFHIVNITQAQTTQTASFTEADAQLAFESTSSFPSIQSSGNVMSVTVPTASSSADFSSGSTVIAPPLHSANSASRRVDLDLNRFVAILWPALVGICMAM